MKRRILVAAAAAGLAGATLCSHAAEVARRKPGLWEVQTTTQGGGSAQGGMPEVTEAMKKMSPEQRTMVERMMKERGVGASGKPNSFRYCLTRERAERDLVPQPDAQTQCTYKTDAVSSSEARFGFACKRQDGSTVDGEGRAHDLAPERYALDLRMKMQHDGQPSEMQMQQTGRWLGADCQGLKPLGN